MTFDVQPPVEPPEEEKWYNRRRNQVLFFIGAFIVLGIIGQIREAEPDPDEFMRGFGDAMLEAGVSEAGWACIEAGLRADGSLDRLMAEIGDSEPPNFNAISATEGLNQFADDNPAFADFLERFVFYAIDPDGPCLTEEERLAFAQSSTEGERLSYGADPQLDSLQDGCATRNMADCDMLYLASPVSSDYERVSLECGGINEAMDVMAPEGCMIRYDDFSEWENVMQQCRDGFYPACDLTFRYSEIGSDEETLGATCGNRRAADEVVPCTLAYGIGSR